MWAHTTSLQILEVQCHSSILDKKKHKNHHHLPSDARSDSKCMLSQGRKQSPTGFTASSRAARAPSGARASAAHTPGHFLKTRRECLRHVAPQTPRRGTFQHTKGRENVAATFTDNLSKGDQESLLPRESASEGTRGRWTGPSEPPPERPERKGVGPPAAFPSRRGWPPPLRPAAGGRHCQQELPRRPSFPTCGPAARRALRGGQFTHLSGGGKGKNAPACNFRQRPSPSVTTPSVAATRSAATRGTQRGTGGGCYGECFGTNGFSERRRSQEEGVEPGCGDCSPSVIYLCKAQGKE